MHELSPTCFNYMFYKITIPRKTIKAFKARTRIVNDLAPSKEDDFDDYVWKTSLNKKGGIRGLATYASSVSFGHPKHCF